MAPSGLGDLLAPEKQGRAAADSARAAPPDSQDGHRESDVFRWAFERFAFDQLLYIVSSSGTTGVPKCLVHGAGDVLLQHANEHQVHCDLRIADRLFYYTTCGLMMWNRLASGLASGATLLLYDGSPFVAGGRILWDYAQSESVTHFGTSAKYPDALTKSGIKPRKQYDLRELRVLLSTGSPLVCSANIRSLLDRTPWVRESHRRGCKV